MWKTLKEYLTGEGIDSSTPLKCFKDAFSVGLIEEKHEGIFIEMLEIIS